MAWLVLIVSGVFEAVWATALGKSVGFTRLIPSIVFILGLIVSMGGLAYALRTLPVGTALRGLGRHRGRLDRRLRDGNRRRVRVRDSKLSSSSASLAASSA